MSKLVKLFVLLLSLAGLGLWGGYATAANITSTTAGGVWDTGSTWVGGVVPAATDNVVIATTGAGSVTGNTSGTSYSCAALTINSGATLTMQRPFTVTGATSITGTINFGSTNTNNVRAMAFNGAVTLNSGAVWDETNGGANTVLDTFTFGGGLTNNGNTFTTLAGSHTFSTANQVIGGTSPINFVGTVAVSGAVTITNNNTSVVTIAGNLTGSTTGSTWVNDTNSTLNYGGATGPMGTRVFTASATGNTVNYIGAAQAVDATTYYNLTLSGSGTKTMPATVTVTHDFIISSGAAVTAGAALTVGGNWTELGPFAQGSGTVTLNGASAQTISGIDPVTFNKLTVSSAIPNITLATNVTVSSTLTGTVTLTSTCPTDYTLTSNGGATVQHSCVTPPAPFAQYLMDESGWNGTPIEVKDSAGSNHGTAATLTTPLPTTANTTPAIAGSPGTCRYGVFDRTKKNYVALPASFPNLGASTGTNTSFTITAWIRTTDNTLGAQRVFIDDELQTQGYGVSLGEGGTGMLRFYTRGTLSPATVLILDTPNVIASNTWYFVAAVADLPNKRKSVYVYSTAGTLLANVSATWTDATFGTGDAGIASIGGETNSAAASENTNAFGFAGNIDEVRVYQSALSSFQVNLVRQIAHDCTPAGPDHILITHAGSALTCSPQTVTITACANAGCTAPHYSAGANVTLTPGGQTFAIDATGINSVATVQQSTSGAATLAAISVPPAAVTPASCWNTATATASCAMTFSNSGFVVTVPNHTSCNSTTATIEAVQTAPGTGRCVPAYRNVTRSVNLYSGYANPASGTQVITASTGTVSTTAPGTTHNLSFDVNGTATISLSYPDAGQLTLTASDTAPTGAAMTGSGTFVVAPASFAFSAIPTAPLTAGLTFNATATAKNGCTTPATTANFINQTVTITSSNPVPAMGNATAINTTLTGFSNGTANASLTWNEVGTIDLNATLANYLGSGLSISGTQAGVGRFQPAYFDTAVTQGCGTFTYAGSTTPAKAGQPFTVTATANRLGGGVTKNYAGASYAYLTTLTNAGVATGLAANTIAAASFANGVGSANVTYAVATPQTAPLTLTLRATDSDTPAVSSSGHTEATAPIRSGRARMLNAYGSELLALPIPVTIEYYDTTPSVGWRTGTDTCTTLSAANFGFSTAPNCTPALTSCNSVVSVSGSGVKPAVSLTKPGVSTSFCVTLDLGTPLEGNQCIATGATSTAATSAGYPWLQYPWTGSAAANPRARATFGIYKSPLIYRRENY